MLMEWDQLNIITRVEDLLRPLISAVRDSRLIEKYRSTEFYRILSNFISENWLLFFYIILVSYLELLYRLWIFKNVDFNYFFSFLFALSGGTVLYIIAGLFPVKAARVVSILTTFAVCLVYGVQLIYYCIFRAPLSLISIGGAGDAMQFWDIVVESVFKNIVAVLFLFAPLAFMILHKKALVYKLRTPLKWSFTLLFYAVSFSSAIVCVTLTGDGPISQYNLYFKDTSPELSMNKLGVMTTMRLDLERLALAELKTDPDGILAEADGGAAGNESGVTGNTESDAYEHADAGLDGKGRSGTAQDGNGQPGQSEKNSGAIAGDPMAGASSGTAQPTDTDGQKSPAVQLKPYNVMDIDFNALTAGGESDPLYPLHKYFSSVQPTATNKYTGMFKGCNLIMLTAEGFSPYAVSPELTPTLYMMANEGFVFNNFYNPVWWVSTSDGEYVACTGLIPKGGVWSFYKSGSNYMPFVMGNQFKKIGYLTKAYHNHTHSYYRRDVSHPNMGYDYKGVGNGLVVKKTWPESDLEMIDVTADEYMDQQPFHTYYMTVSGHMNYSFGGNQMARKNRELVEHLPYSDTSKAYIACNLELEFAMKSLMDRLEDAGIAENTVIVISADHYPYGLEKQYLDELAGHEVEKNFELYKSTLIIYKKGMEPIIVDKPCASLDIIPTLSNLFGLEFDSRLLMGTDILSDTPALTIFSNRSWITDRAMYNSASNKVEFTDGTVEDKDYVKLVNRTVADKFKYSARILETDYYGKLFKDDD